MIVPYLNCADSYQKMCDALKEAFTKGELLKEHLKKDVDSLPKMNGKSDAKFINFKHEVTHIASTVKECPNEGDDFRLSMYSHVINKFDNDTRLELARKYADLDDLVKRIDKWVIAKNERIASTSRRLLVRLLISRRFSDQPLCHRMDQKVVSSIRNNTAHVIVNRTLLRRRVEDSSVRRDGAFVVLSLAIGQMMSVVL